MKVLVLTVLLVACVNAGFLTDIKSALNKFGTKVKDTFEKIGTGVKETNQAFVPYAENVGKELLKDAAQSGISVVSNTVTDLLSGAISSLFSKIGRDTSIMDKLVNFEHEMKNMLLKGVEEFTPVITSAFQEMEKLAHKVKMIDFDLPQLEHDIESIILGHQHQGNTFLLDLISSIETLINNNFGVQTKRSTFGDTLKSLTDLITGFFKPAIQNVHNLLGSAGQALKNVAGNVVSTVEQSVSHLGEKLAPHMANLKNQAAELFQHGNTALSAIKDATTDILGQTVANVGSTISGLTHKLEGQ
ncbi:hypothetical protein SNE40_001427 [Patella caerulea]|uniref:Uncharacterized protein n=1 Tax=Patella caerulea TaxID=87958 RepID=A0AAN8KNP4_PATCE